LLPILNICLLFASYLLDDCFLFVSYLLPKLCFQFASYLLCIKIRDLKSHCEPSWSCTNTCPYIYCVILVTKGLRCRKCDSGPHSE
jgi:hypothetical protein